MPILTPEEAVAKRTQLCKEGYCVIPGVMPQDLLEDFRTWTNELFERTPIHHAMRYQGSDIYIMPTRCWPKEKVEPADPAVTQGYEGDTMPLGSTSFITHHTLIGRLNDIPEQNEVAKLLQLENLRPGNGNSKWGEPVVDLISKPPYGLPLYWHQDYMGWNNPLATLPWPQVIFFSYYLTDTTRENGCLRVIPGSHLRHHPLHELLPNAHEPEIQSLYNLGSPIFQNAEGAIDVPMKAGDLILGDARLLHSAWPNTTSQRRTLTLAWHNVFDSKKPPSWWTEPVPQLILDAWAEKNKPRYTPTRCANLPWRPRGADFTAKWGTKYPEIRELAKGTPQPDAKL